MSNLLVAIALSHHLSNGTPVGGEYNSVHPHVRIENNGYIAGAYINSFYDVSAYAGYRFEYEDHGIELGAVTGYEALGEALGVIPYVRYTYDVSNKYRLFVSPSGEVDQNNNFYVGAVIGVELKLKD